MKAPAAAWNSLKIQQDQANESFLRLSSAFVHDTGVGSGNHASIEAKIVMPL